MSESIYPSVKDLTLEEKASLTSGGDAWHLQGVEAKGIPGYMITDGPTACASPWPPAPARPTLTTQCPPPVSRQLPACPVPGILSSSTRLAKQWLRSAFKKRWP